MHRAVPLLVLAAWVSPVAAQDRPAADSTGRWSLSVAFPTSGATSFGIWRLLSRRINAGIGVGIRVFSGESEDRSPDGTLRILGVREVNVSLEPATRVYLAIRRPVKPFLLFGASYSLRDRDDDPVSSVIETMDYRWFGRAAVGVEWFPVSPVSFAAWTGFQVSGLVSDRTSASSGRSRTSYTEVASVTGALTLQLYF
jgi:hypothetical protein